MTEWQLIETAPKYVPGKKMDYIRILAHDGREVSVTYWSGYEWKCEAEPEGVYDGYVGYACWFPTHWMPLPPI